MRCCNSCKHRIMDIKAMNLCGIVIDKCNLTGKCILYPVFDGRKCKDYKKMVHQEDDKA